MTLWTELRRRSIFKVGVTYAVLAWLIVQIANNFFVPLNLPPDGQSFIVNEMVGSNAVQLLAVLNWNVQQ